jgi:hypothetical protein
VKRVADNTTDTTLSDDEYMLTTYDNPFDPFTQWTQWYAFDEGKGYCSCGLVARIARSSNDLSDADHSAAIQSAIDEITRENVSGIHKKVKRGDMKPSSS